MKDRNQRIKQVLAAREAGKKLPAKRQAQRKLKRTFYLIGEYYWRKIYHTPEAIKTLEEVKKAFNKEGRRKDVEFLQQVISDVTKQKEAQK
jgi:predicted solute-binding protein